MSFTKIEKVVDFESDSATEWGNAPWGQAGWGGGSSIWTKITKEQP